MKIFPKQRGQSVVEFSLILPIFALLLFAMIHMGFFLLDYQTLNSAAGVAARDAKIHNGTINNDLVTRIKGTQFFLPWYEMDSASPWIVPEGHERYDAAFVTVMIKMNITNDANENFFLSFLPEAYTVLKAAYIGTDETEPGNGNEIP